ncbi:hypothetical protein BSKO_02489 [Bryopsis sp. KO-2023]|nr:hypothetical protein BSKO_02489 [Bryopsis sp. KO-2023]
MSLEKQPLLLKVEARVLPGLFKRSWISAGDDFRRAYLYFLDRFAFTAPCYSVIIDLGQSLDEMTLGDFNNAFPPNVEPWFLANWTTAANFEEDKWAVFQVELKKKFLGRSSTEYEIGIKRCAKKKDEDWMGFIDRLQIEVEAVQDEVGVDRCRNLKLEKRCIESIAIHGATGLAALFDNVRNWYSVLTMQKETTGGVATTSSGTSEPMEIDFGTRESENGKFVEEYAVLDTGSETNVMHSNIANRLGIMGGLLDSKCQIRMANGSTCKPMGITPKVRISIGGKSVESQFVVLADPGYETLVGVGFLDEINADIQLASGVQICSFQTEGRVILNGQDISNSKN